MELRRLKAKGPLKVLYSPPLIDVPKKNDTYENLPFAIICPRIAIFYSNIARSDFESLMKVREENIIYIFPKVASLEHSLCLCCMSLSRLVRKRRLERKHRSKLSLPAQKQER